jgi:radical SAM superfamily enzyme YgiQ (UPF0313 family)
MVLIRPPSEANSLIIQVTYGCSDNNCIFCPAYKDDKFKIRDITEIEREITESAELYPETRRIFFADGDAIIIPQDKLVKIFKLANDRFKSLTRISVYGSIKSIKTKSVDELVQLKNLKLGIIYMGMETGDEEVYKYIRKYGNPQGNIDTCLKIKQTGIKVNVTVILGLGGRSWSHQHAVNTAKMLNACQPEQVAALTLMVVPGTPIHGFLQKKEFVMLDKLEILNELKILIENLSEFRCLFFSNHASNYYQLQSRFPADKQRVIQELSRIIQSGDTGGLVPDFLRGL